MMLLMCTKCDIEKEEDAFPKAKVTKSGRAGECKQCKAVRTKKLRDERCEMLLKMFESKCSDCGREDDRHSFFDFHHINKENKLWDVKQIMYGNIDKILTEAGKCVMLCPNCHRERHLSDGDLGITRGNEK